MDYSVEAIKKRIIDNVKWKTGREHLPGGQAVTICDTTIRLVSDELNLEIVYGCNRSQIKNKEEAYKLFEQVLNDKIK